jgi:ABC-2 type transport system permease protein
VPIIRDLYERRTSLVIWTVGLAALSAVFVVLTKTIVQPLLSIPAFAAYFALFLKGDVYTSFLGYTWFGFAQLLMAGFAITHVAHWTAEDADGRLDLILSNPISRVRVVVERVIVLTLGALVIAGVSGVAVGMEAHYQSIDLDRRRLAEATLLLVPFTLVFGAAGALLAAWIPRAAVGLLGAFAFASYLLVQLGPIFKLPEWAEDLSAFKLYGQPLVAGVDQTGLVTMLAIVLGGLAASAIVMQRRDIGT